MRSHDAFGPVIRRDSVPAGRECAEQGCDERVTHQYRARYCEDHRDARSRDSQRRFYLSIRP